MAFDFPASPAIGDKYPVPSVVGLPTYTWDGEKWTTVGVQVGGSAGSNAAPLMDGVANPGTLDKYSRGDHIHPSDTSRASVAYVDAAVAPKADKTYVDNTMLAKAGGQTTTGGFAFTTYSNPNGNLALNPMLGNYQSLNNVGAFTITAPTIDCAIDMVVWNSATAGAISFSGFRVGTTGDALTTAAGSWFIISFRRMSGTATYMVKALQ
jgi:hypothetical protein